MFELKNKVALITRASRGLGKSMTKECHLSSDECSYMSGSIINIHGGWTCHL